MSFVTHAQNKDAAAFKALVEETLAGKVVQVLEGLKIEVASNFLDTVSEEGGVSGGVASVKKKPAPPAAGSVELPGTAAKGGSVEHAGRSSKGSDVKLPGQKVSEGRTSSEPNPKGDRVKAVQTDKKPHLSSKPKMDRGSFKEELEFLGQTLEEAQIKPGTEEHMAHHVHAVHTGEMMGHNSGGGHVETNHYHIHHSGVEMNTDSKGNSADSHTYHVMPKGSGMVHKFTVTPSSKQPGVHHVTHVGTI